jgi:hypothetical protein
VYFVVSWDISANNPVWSQIDERMRNCLTGYQSVRPVNTFYMVKVSNSNQHRTILAALQDIAANSHVMVKVVVSPLLTVTGWDGWLQPDEWPKVFAMAN